MRRRVDGAASGLRIVRLPRSLFVLLPVFTRCCFLLCASHCASESIPEVVGNGKEEFEIAEIVGEYRDGPRLYYLIAWKGYPPSTNTWHAVEDLPHAQEAIAEFVAQGKVVPYCRLPVQYPPRAVDSYPAAAKPAFVLSGMDPAERPALIALIEELGGTVITDEELNAAEFDWDRVTHVICEAHPLNGLKRSMKVFMCITWGIHMTRTTYLLHPSFLTQSKALGRFAEEKDFLWANRPELLTNGTPPSLIRRIQRSARPPIGREEYDYDPAKWRPPHVCIGYARMDDNREPRTRLLTHILRRKFNDTSLTFVDLDAEPDKLHECTRIVYGSEPTDEDLRQLVRAQNRQLDEYRTRTNDYVNDRWSDAGVHIAIGWLMEHILEGHNDDITEHPTTGEEHFTHHPRRGPAPARQLFYSWDTSSRLRRITMEVVVEELLSKSTRRKRERERSTLQQSPKTVATSKAVPKQRSVSRRATTTRVTPPAPRLVGIELNPGPGRCATCIGEFSGTKLDNYSAGVAFCSRCLVNHDIGIAIISSKRMRTDSTSSSNAKRLQESPPPRSNDHDRLHADATPANAPPALSLVGIELNPGPGCGRCGDRPPSEAGLADEQLCVCLLSQASTESDSLFPHVPSTDHLVPPRIRQGLALLAAMNKNLQSDGSCKSCGQEHPPSVECLNLLDGHERPSRAPTPLLDGLQQLDQEAVQAPVANLFVDASTSSLSAGDAEVHTTPVRRSKRARTAEKANTTPMKKLKREQPSADHSATRLPTPPPGFAYAVIGDDEPLANALVLKPTDPYPPTPVHHILQHDTKYARETGKHEYIVFFDVADHGPLQPNRQYPVETLFPEAKWGRLAGMNHPMVRAFHVKEQHQKLARRIQSTKEKSMRAAAEKRRLAKISKQVGDACSFTQVHMKQRPRQSVQLPWAAPVPAAAESVPAECTRLHLELGQSSPPSERRIFLERHFPFAEARLPKPIFPGCDQCSGVANCTDARQFAQRWGEYQDQFKRWHRWTVAVDLLINGRGRTTIRPSQLAPCGCSATPASVRALPLTPPLIRRNGPGVDIASPMPVITPPSAAATAVASAQHVPATTPPASRLVGIELNPGPEFVESLWVPATPSSSKFAPMMIPLRGGAVPIFRPCDTRAVRSLIASPCSVTRCRKRRGGDCSSPATPPPPPLVGVEPNPGPSISNYVVLVFGMANVNDAFIRQAEIHQRSNTSHAPVRDAARLKSLHALLTGSKRLIGEEVKIITFNMQQTVADCTPNAHVQGEWTRRCAQDLVEAHSDLVHNCRLILFDYFRFLTAYGESNFRILFTETFEALIKVGIFTPRTKVFIPSYVAFIDDFRHLSSRSQHAIDALPVRGSANPLFRATASLEDELSNHPRKKQELFRGLSNASEASLYHPFQLITLVSATTLDSHCERLSRKRTLPLKRTLWSYHNRPPAYGSDTRQIFDQTDTDSSTSLAVNCRQLGVEIFRSTVPDAGNGLFAQRNFDEGEIVGYLFGDFITRSRFDAMRKRRILPSTRAEIEHMQDRERGISRIIDVTDSLSDAADEYLLLVSRQCPAGYINDPKSPSRSKRISKAGTSQANCVVIRPRLLTATSELEQFDWRDFAIRTIRRVHAGEELFFEYEWTAADWRNAVSTASTRRRDATIKCISLSRSVKPPLRPQLVGVESNPGPDLDIPIGLAAFEQQERLLRRFVSEHLVEFERQRYAPFTVTARRCDVRQPVQTCVRPSDVLPGTAGVFLTEASRSISSRSAAVLASYYPGVVMSLPLHDSFIRRYHCPTAVRCKTLDYTDEQGFEHEFVIVGWPTRVGAIINDAMGTRCRVNCALECVNPSSKSDKWLVPPSESEGAASECTQFEVFDHVVTIYTMPHEHDTLRSDFLPSRGELFLSYDNATFWRLAHEEGDYCQGCFRRDFAPSGSTSAVRCSTPSCRVVRHRKCVASLSRKSASTEERLPCGSCARLQATLTIAPRRTIRLSMQRQLTPRVKQGTNPSPLRAQSIGAKRTVTATTPPGVNTATAGISCKRRALTVTLTPRDGRGSASTARSSDGPPSQTTSRTIAPAQRVPRFTSTPDVEDSDQDLSAAIAASHQTLRTDVQRRALLASDPDRLQRILDLLADEGAIATGLHQVPGDGNCMLHAVAHCARVRGFDEAMCRLYEPAPHLRAMNATTIRRHLAMWLKRPTSYKQLVALLPPSPLRTPDHVADIYQLDSRAHLRPSTKKPVSLVQLSELIDSRQSVWRTIDVTLECANPQGDFFDFLPSILSLVYPIQIVCIVSRMVMIDVAHTPHPSVSRFFHAPTTCQKGSSLGTVFLIQNMAQNHYSAPEFAPGPLDSSTAVDCHHDAPRIPHSLSPASYGRLQPRSLETTMANLRQTSFTSTLAVGRTHTSAITTEQHSLSSSNTLSLQSPVDTINRDVIDQTDDDGTESDSEFEQCSADSSDGEQHEFERPRGLALRTAKRACLLPRYQRVHAPLTAHQIKLADDLLYKIVRGKWYRPHYDSKLNRFSRSQHWLKLKWIAHDLAHFRACCGAKGGSAGSWYSDPIAFMRQRIELRAAFDSYKAYRSSLTEILNEVALTNQERARSPLDLQPIALAENDAGDEEDEAMRSLTVAAVRAAQGQPATVFFRAQEICPSCYVSIHGIGRSSAYEFLEKREQTLAGATADRRARTHQLIHQAMNTILQYTRKNDQHNPNPKGKDINRRSITLPFTTRAQFYAKLKEPASQGGLDVKFSFSTLARAMKKLEAKGYSIQIAKYKAMARCAHCSTLQAQISREKNAKQKLFLESQLNDHVALYTQQRDFFDGVKEEALRPWRNAHECRMDERFLVRAPYAPTTHSDLLAQMLSAQGRHQLLTDSGVRYDRGGYRTSACDPTAGRDRSLWHALAIAFEREVTQLQDDCEVVAKHFFRPVGANQTHHEQRVTTAILFLQQFAPGPTDSRRITVEDAVESPETTLSAFCAALPTSTASEHHVTLLYHRHLVTVASHATEEEVDQILFADLAPQPDSTELDHVSSGFDYTKLHLMVAAAESGQLCAEYAPTSLGVSPSSVASSAPASQRADCTLLIQDYDAPHQFHIVWQKQGGRPQWRFPPASGQIPRVCIARIWLSLGGYPVAKPKATCIRRVVQPPGPATGVAASNSQDGSKSDSLAAAADAEFAALRALLEQQWVRAKRIWCVTFDGMDQAKTRLPSRIRYSKSLDGKERLGVHVVGGMFFGAPLPVLAVLNYPHVNKDSSSTITTFERMLDLQFEELMEKLKKMKDAPVDTGGRRIMLAWPEALHVTFDNATGEAKNQFFLRYLGLLVKHGIFRYITVSNMIVGHTHGIVDQMFSVFAKTLRLHDAHTLTAMKALFSEFYSSRIQGIIEATQNGTVDQLRKDEVDSEQPEDHPNSIDVAMWKHAMADLEEFAKEMREVAQSMGIDASPPPAGPGSDTNREATPAGAPSVESDTAIAAGPAKARGIRPYVVQQDFAIDARTWYKNHLSSSNEHKLTHLSKVFNFGIELDQDGTVYLYSRASALSIMTSNETIQHNYLGMMSGDWTTRTPLVSHFVTADPLRLAPVSIDTQPLRQTFKAYFNERAITEQELDELNRVLNGFDEESRQLAEACAQCSEHQRKIAAIGVIHRGGDMTADEVAHAKEQHSRKETERELWRAHMNSVPHGPRVLTGWWTKWLDRERDYIRPSYEHRGLVLTEEQKAERYHCHPKQMPSGPNEPPFVRAEQTRADVACFQDRGLPEKGQLLITRSDRSNEGCRYYPFFVARVIGVYKTRQAAEEQLSVGNRAKSRKSRTKVATPEKSSAPLALEALVSTASDSIPRTRPTRRAATDGRASTRRVAMAEAPGAADSDDDAMPIDGATVTTSTIDHDDEYMPPADRDSNDEEEYEEDSNRATAQPLVRSSGTDPGRSPRARSSTIGVESSSAASDVLPDQYLLVHWYDFAQSSNTALRLNDPEVWAAEEVRAQREARAATGPVIDTSSLPQKDSQWAPAWMIKRWEKVAFQPVNEKGEEKRRVIALRECILWGPSDQVLTKAHQLTAPTFARILRDLNHRDAALLSKAAQSIKPTARRAPKSAASIPKKQRGTTNPIKK